jgi:hypothetical protein
MFAQSGFGYNSTPLDLLRESLPWLLPVIAVFGFDEEQWQLIIPILLLQIACNTLIIAIFQLPIALQEIQMSSISGFAVRGDLSILASGSLENSSDVLSGAMLLALFLPYLRWRGRIVVVGGLLTYIIIATISMFRSFVIEGLASLILGLTYIPMRTAVRLTRRSKQAIGLVVAVLVILVIFSSISQEWLQGSSNVMIRNLAAAILGLQGRFEESKTEDNLYFRLKEAQAGLGESNDLQIVFGKGVAATWSGYPFYFEVRNMLHFSPAQLILKGGIILLLLYMIFPFGVSLKAFFTSRDPLTLMCACFIILRMVSVISHNIFYAWFVTILLWLCAGRCMVQNRIMREAKICSDAAHSEKPSIGLSLPRRPNVTNGLSSRREAINQHNGSQPKRIGHL